MDEVLAGDSPLSSCSLLVDSEDDLPFGAAFSLRTTLSFSLVPCDDGCGGDFSSGGSITGGASLRVSPWSRQSLSSSSFLRRSITAGILYEARVRRNTTVSMESIG